MARSTYDKFSALLDNLRTDNESTISSRCKAITKRLNIDFWDSTSELSHTRYAGSYGRGTEIKGFSDVDLLAMLPYSIYERFNSYQGNGQSALLQAVRASILATYPSTSVGGDGQVVVVSFADGTMFEVLPSFINKDGSYTYANSNGGGSWRVTNPVPEIEAVNEANKKYNKNVKHLARMARAWKKKNAVPMNGLLIDTMVCNFMPTWEYNDRSLSYYDYMIRDFMKHLAGCNPKQEYWAAPGSGQRVYRSGAFEAKAKRAYESALDAIKYEADGKEWSANESWKAIFGNLFIG